MLSVAAMAMSVVWLGTAMCELSFCAAYSQYGDRLSTARLKRAEVGWLWSVDQDAPPFSDTVAPPSLPSIILLAFFGSIQSAC